MFPSASALLIVSLAGVPLSTPSQVTRVASASTAAPSSPGAGIEKLDFKSSPDQRVSVPVRIESAGQYAFVIDTGAEQTVISSELAERLKLASAGTLRVDTTTEASDIAAVLLPPIHFGEKRVEASRVPIFNRRFLGADGMLGVDSLQAARISIDFATNVIAVAPAARREERWSRDALVVTARSRFGRLVLGDADIDGEKIWVIVDTGSEVTIGNPALRRRLMRNRQLGPLQPATALSVTGASLHVEMGRVRSLRFGPVSLSDVAIGFADAHVFKKLGLEDAPALLLGIDVLRLFKRVSIDFPNRRLRLLVEPQVRPAGVWR